MIQISHGKIVLNEFLLIILNCLVMMITIMSAIGIGFWPFRLLYIIKISSAVEMIEKSNFHTFIVLQ